MFGIKMRTSVGQCTRGVNMQLLAVEGRPEYDYVLLLDTEGTRAPEYHGLPGSEKRDNRMATLSILLSDATIIVIPGENDAAVKEILPIVLMAYEGSKLAEDNGGRLSSRMFFLYNRIDTNQKNMLENIIQSLGKSLHAAFSQVQSLTGNLTNLKSESPFGSFNLDSSSSTSDRDVCILGNVKSKSEPPGDVPDDAYGEALIKFREHIHQRVVSNVEGKAWESTTADKFSNYINEVWYCICSADFNLNFSTVIERMTFDQLDMECKLKEQALAEAYMESFKEIKRKMRDVSEEGGNRNNNDEDYSSFILQLECVISPTLSKLNDELKVIVGASGREKWSAQFWKMWELNKKEQEEIWKNNVKNAFNRIFLYEQNLENYKKKMRQEINEFFKLPKTEWNVELKLNEKFEYIFRQKLSEIREEYPEINVANKVMCVYQENSRIRNRKMKYNLVYDSSALEYRIKHWENLKIGSELVQWFAAGISKLTCFVKGEKKKNLDVKEAAVCYCLESVDRIVENIATGKMCYDDSIVTNFIFKVDDVIKKHSVTDNTDIEKLHKYALLLIVEILVEIQNQWETSNSVYAKFKCSEGIMRNYFDLVSKGAAKTKIFSSTMAKTLSYVFVPGILI
jgi:hypothetical protein